MNVRDNEDFKPVDLTPGKMVFVDTKTMAPVVRSVADSLPAANPATGKRTLMPGLYCSTCQKWYPVPPPDEINRRPNAALCPETQEPLISDGPWPEESAAELGSD